MLPSFKDPSRFAPDPADSPQRPRERLFFFSGDLGSPAGSQNAGPHTHANYSLGLRQVAYRAARSGRGGNGGRGGEVEVVGHLPKDWWHAQYEVRLRSSVTLPLHYRYITVTLPLQARLRSSIFCGAFPGDGWSGGVSSAVLAGCVPVIVMDGIEMPFENVLDYSSFSIRLTEAQLPQLPHLLRAVPRARVAALQEGLRRVRSRFTYASTAANDLRVSPNASLAAPVLARVAAVAAVSEDVLDTVLRVLLHRAANRPQKRNATA